MGKLLAYGAGFYLGLVLLKDGTIPGLAQDAARFIGDSARGLRPITAAA